MSDNQELVVLGSDDLRELQRAKNLLENPGLAAQLSNLAGKPLEYLLDQVPDGVEKALAKVLETTLTKLVVVAQKTLGETRQSAWNKTHLASVMVSGGVAGFFGLPALLAEAPITTTIIFRSISDIARAEGEAMGTEEAIGECLKVFALGGESSADDGAETGYYAARLAFNSQVQASVQFLAQQAKNSTSSGDSPMLLQLISWVSKSLGINFSERSVAQAIPVIGALGGATLNAIFINHFQDMATGHFTVRRLERQYGVKAVREAYASLPQSAPVDVLPEAVLA